MADEFKLNFNSLGFVISKLTELIRDPTKEYRVTIKRWKEKRSLSQNAFQHVIYSELSKYLVSKGRKDWTEEKVKFEMKNNFLGWRQTECVNVFTGEMTTREILRETSKLDVGDSFQYTTQLLDFAQSIGCTIKIPDDCEYMNLSRKQIE